MNESEYTYLLTHPDTIDSEKLAKLDEIVQEFPYFQSVRALQLKGLKNTNSFKYNQALKKTASYTIDRSILFDFITSSYFNIEISIDQGEIENLEIVEAETIEVLHKKITDSIALEKEQSEEAEPKVQEEKAVDILEIGQPIAFTNSEPHSFNEWMQLISQKPIDRSETDEKQPIVKNKKTEIIDKFIELSPKIPPIDKHAKNEPVIFDKSNENDSIMTETLAKVYLEQKKYDNAIKAYRILSLKYPEKSGFFADRIKAIKIIQRNKS